jgi:hypothetical protein
VLKYTKELHSLNIFPYKIVCYEVLIVATTLLDTILKYEKVSALVKNVSPSFLSQHSLQGLTNISWWGEAVMNNLYYTAMYEQNIVCS